MNFDTNENIIDKEKDELNKNGRKKDYDHNHFVIDNNNVHCKLDNCNKKFSLQTSITVLKNHILKDHDKTPIKNIPSDNNNNTIRPCNSRWFCCFKRFNFNGCIFCAHNKR